MLSRAFRRSGGGGRRYNGGGKKFYGRRFTSTSSEPQQTTTVIKSGSRRWKAALALLLGGGSAIYLLDLWVNDDIEILTDRFRSKLNEAERKDRPHIVILGSGWGALNVLRKLHTDKFNVTLISPRNYFLFTPLLPSTTSGTVENRSIMEPIRKYCNRSDAPEVRFVEVECTNIDPKNKTIRCVDTSEVTGVVSELDLKYDHLVVAVGAETATFGVPGVAQNALYMKSIDDSAKIRNRIMDCLETAAIPGQPQEEIDRLLHFVVVGGGPSGVEFTAELHDFVKRDIRQNFPEYADKVRITLVEALPRILNSFDTKVTDFVENKFNGSKGIQVWTKSAVTEVKPKTLVIKGSDGNNKDVPYGALVWVTGNAPKKVVSDLITELGPQNQPIRRALSVDEHLRVVGAENVWALGDCSATKQNLPPTAQVASQEGKYLGRLFNKLADDIHKDSKEKKNEATEKSLQTAAPFEYHHFGSFAYVGGYEAVADFRRGKEKGPTIQGLGTFLIWRSVYLSNLLSLRNRVLVVFDWTKTFVFGRDVSRG